MPCASNSQSGCISCCKVHNSLSREQNDIGIPGQTLATGWTGPLSIPRGELVPPLPCQVCVGTVGWSCMVTHLLPGLNHSSLSSNPPLKPWWIRNKIITSEKIRVLKWLTISSVREASHYLTFSLCISMKCTLESLFRLLCEVGLSCFS